MLCVTETGHQLHATAFKRTLGWTAIAEGRRIHDLRHTAACLWLARGVDPATVQAWMGHASIATTNLYLHHLGTASDRAGLARLNQATGCTRGARGVRELQNHKSVIRRRIASSDLVRPTFDVGGAKGIRTPDLLVANETRYQLRHSPADRPAADQHADFTIATRRRPRDCRRLVLARERPSRARARRR